MNSTVRCSFFHAAAAVAAILFALGNVAHAETIGGWDASRGGTYDAILTGSSSSMLRQEVGAHFAGTNLVESPYLSSTFLNSIDVLYIGAVNYAFGEVNPLDSTEQSNLATWVGNGGRALLVTDNPAFAPAGNSMVNPFGLSTAGSGDGIQYGTITNHTSFPTITDGPFGTVNTVYGGYVGSYNPSLPASAAALGTWNSLGTPAVVAMTYGSGRVVFYADDALMGDAADNRVMLDNVLAFAGVPQPSPVPEPSSIVLVGGLLGILLAARRLSSAVRAASGKYRAHRQRPWPEIEPQT